MPSPLGSDAVMQYIVTSQEEHVVTWFKIPEVSPASIYFESTVNLRSLYLEEAHYAAGIKEGNNIIIHICVWRGSYLKFYSNSHDKKNILNCYTINNKL